MIYIETSYLSGMQFEVDSISISYYNYYNLYRTEIKKLENSYLNFDALKYMKHMRLTKENGLFKIRESKTHKNDSIIWSRKWSNDDKIFITGQQTINFGIVKTEPDTYIVIKTEPRIEQEYGGNRFVFTKIYTVKFFIFKPDPFMNVMSEYSKTITSEQKREIKTCFNQLSTDRSVMNVYLDGGVCTYSRSELGLLSSTLISEQCLNGEDIFIPMIDVTTFSDLMTAIKAQNWDLIKNFHVALNFLDSSLLGALIEKLPQGEYF